MAEQLHREIFEKLKESVPGLEWNLGLRDESGGALITASSAVHRFDEEINPVASIFITERCSRWYYSVRFMQVTQGFATSEAALGWLLSAFRQFAVEED